MNTRVEEHKDEDGRAHVSNTDPHADDGSGVVVALQVTGLLSLHQDDDGVDNLVKLAEVEDPAVECESFIPQSTRSQCGRRVRFEELVCCRVGREPEVDVRRRVVDRSVSVALRSLDLAHGIDRRHQSTLGPLPRRDKRPSVSSCNNPHESPCRVDGKENVMQHNEPEECTRLADRPGFSAAGPVVLVERLDDDGIDDRDV